MASHRFVTSFIAGLFACYFPTGSYVDNIHCFYSIALLITSYHFHFSLYGGPKECHALVKLKYSVREHPFLSQDTNPSEPMRKEFIHVHSFLRVISRLLDFISGSDRIANPNVMKWHDCLTEMIAGKS